jgi:hypothetical protein
LKVRNQAAGMVFGCQPFEEKSSLAGGNVYNMRN